MAPRRPVRNHRNVHHLGAHKHPPSLAVPLEPVADGLAQRRGPRRLVPMLTPVGSILGVALQSRQHLLVAVGKPHTLDDQVLAMLLRQAIRQPQGQRTIIGNAGHAQLATARFIPAAQHEELVAAGILPVLQPFLMTVVAILLQVMLLTPQLLRPEAQSDPALRNVGFQSNQPVSKISEPPLLLMNLIPSAPLSGIGNLPLGPINPPLQTVLLQPLRPPHRRHLAIQRHPHPVEQPRRYPVLLDVVALQRCRRPARHNIGEELPLYPAVQLGVGRQPSIALRRSLPS